MNPTLSLSDAHLYRMLVFLGAVCLMAFGPQLYQLRTLCLGDSPTVTASK